MPRRVCRLANTLQRTVNDPRAYALVEGNNFYVSCERLFDPKLETRPVIVMSNNDGMVISRSAEVKALGVKMGAPVQEIYSIDESFLDLTDLPGRDLTAHAQAIRTQFGVVMEHTVSELRGIGCQPLEAVAPDKKQILSSRSFGRLTMDVEALAESVTMHVSTAYDAMGGSAGCAGLRSSSDL